MQRPSGTRSPPAPAEARPFAAVQEKKIIVGISELRLTADPTATLVTYALGSCVAVLIHDPVRCVAGLIHYMLPDSAVATQGSQAQKPAMFADLGIPQLVRELEALGCVRPSLVVKAAGGGALYDDRGVFRIGERNVLALHEMLRSAGVTLAAEDVGGTQSRTVRIHVGTGVVTVKSQGKEATL